jgi:soluble P-type ATPase
MSVRVPLPAGDVTLTNVICDVNGTLTDRGGLIPGVTDRLARLREQLRVLLVSSDSYGTLDAVAAELAVEGRRVTDAEQKLAVLHELGASTTVAIGNGHNDRLVLAAAALGIAVLGPEGAAASALASADMICRSISDALDALLDPRCLAATLRP